MRLSWSCVRQRKGRIQEREGRCSGTLWTVPGLFGSGGNRGVSIATTRCHGLNEGQRYRERPLVPTRPQTTLRDRETGFRPRVGLLRRNVPTSIQFGSKTPGGDDGRRGTSCSGPRGSTPLTDPELGVGVGGGSVVGVIWE